MFLPRLTVTAIVVAVAWLAGDGARRGIERLGRLRKIEPSLLHLFGEVVRGGIFAIGGIVALGTLGIDVSALVAGLGLTGLAIGLALKEIISNMLAGIMVIVYKPFKHNDRIAVTTFEGRVVEINLRFTTLEAGDKRIYVPNAMVISNAVVVDKAAATGPGPVSGELRQARIVGGFTFPKPTGCDRWEGAVPPTLFAASRSHRSPPVGLGTESGVQRNTAKSRTATRPLLALLSFPNGDRLAVACVRQWEMLTRISSTPSCCDHVPDAAPQGHHRPAAGLVADLDVAPGDAPTPAGAQGLQDRLLGRPAAGEMLRRLPAALAVADLLRRVHAIDEQLAVPLDHPRNPQTLRDVGADANDVRHEVKDEG